ncbi:FtsX-like permease family protein [Spiroplasma sp. TIUS-1]|uniref:FtsX-like permease family protein n=1 Tax=Spiroplasma sp. TIUS-1 TaxID=216963 RepID=UPI0013A6F3A7|nr:FtsX-like permease family protein [Spiroplasma sp. TIUS-1]
MSLSILISQNNEITKKSFKHDFSYKMTTSNYSANDTQTLSPWFAFNIDTTESDKSGRKYNYISFQDPNKNSEEKLNEHQSALLGFSEGDFKVATSENERNTYESNIVYLTKNKKIINFNFGDLDSIIDEPNQREKSFAKKSDGTQIYESDYVFNASQEEINKVVRSGKFGLLYKFNFNSEYFNRSLIGQLYSKFNLRSNEYNVEQEKTANLIYEYMFYLNNSSITNVVKNDILRQIDKGVNNIEEYLNNKTYGFIENGRYVLGKSEEGDFSASGESYEIKYNDIDNSLETQGSYLVKDFESTNNFTSAINNKPIYKIGDKILKNEGFYTSYYLMVAQLTEFDLDITRQVVMWNELGEKFRIISAFQNEQGKQYDDLNLTLFEKRNLSSKEDSLFGSSTFVSSQSYGRAKSWKVGDDISIIPGLGGIKFRLDGYGVDARNLYPTIYEEDLIPNQLSQAIFYINSYDYKNLFNRNTKISKPVVNNNKFQDVSRIFLRSKNPVKHNMLENIEMYKLYMADKSSALGDISAKLLETNNNENIKVSNNVIVQDYGETSFINKRQTLLKQVIDIYIFISILVGVVMIAVIVFVVYNIFNKILNSQRKQIATLKALGYRKSKLIFSFVSFMALPIFIIVPICWILGVFAQIPILNIFSVYFNIENSINYDWELFLVEFFVVLGIIIALVWFIAYSTIKESALSLMEPKYSKNSTTISSLFAKIFKPKTTSSKLRVALIGTSIRDISLFFITILISITILTAGLVVPTTLNNVKNEYYKPVKMENNYSYTGTIDNVPITRYSFFDNNPTSIYNNNPFAYKFNSNNSKYVNEGPKNIFEVTNEDGSWKDDYKDFFDSEQYSSIFDNAFANSLMTFKGANINIKLLDRMANIDKQINGSSKPVTKQIENLACVALPSLFGQSPISGIGSNYESTYSYCIKEMSNNILPSTIKEDWNNDEESFKNFMFNFGSIPIDKKDDLYTGFVSTIENKSTSRVFKDVNVVGVANDQRSIDLKHSNLISKPTGDGEKINVLVSDQIFKRGFDIGSEIEMKFNRKFLDLNTIDNSEDKFRIYYEGESTDINSKEFDLSKLTYSEDIAKADKSYKLMQNIKLKIDKTIIENDKELKKSFDKTKEDYEKYVNSLNEKPVKVYMDNIIKEDDKSIIISPYDIRLANESGELVDLDSAQLIDLMSKGGTNNLLNLSLANKLFTVKTDYEKISELTLVVAGAERIYDRQRILMNQVDANKILGLRNPSDSVELFDGREINIWSNSKMSRENNINDQIKRMMMTTELGNNATSNLDDSLIESVGKVDYVSKEKEAFINMIVSSYSISIIFVVIFLIVAIITLYNITDIFVGKFKIFIGFMRLQGYRKGEINAIIMSIFLPVAILGIIIPLVAYSIILGVTLPNALLAAEVSVPFIISWWIIPIVFIVGIIIYLITYFAIFESMKRVSLSKIMGD